jgi:hypothetical protein
VTRRAEPSPRRARSRSRRGADDSRVAGSQRGRPGARPARDSGGSLPHPGGMADGQLRSSDPSASRGDGALRSGGETGGIASRYARWMGALAGEDKGIGRLEREGLKTQDERDSTCSGSKAAAHRDHLAR